MSRGEVRSAVLLLLVEQPRHGYEIMQELEQRSEGGWQPSPGSIYPTLQQLADEGLVESRPEGGKNIFTITDTGTAKAAEVEAPPWERLAGDGSHGGLRAAMGQLAGAARQVGSAGSSEQVEKATEIITDARKAIYRLLADD